MLMYRLKAPQKLCKIGNVTFGGQPSVKPPVVIGGMFQEGDKNVLNHKTGEFKTTQVEKDMNILIEWAEKTGFPVAFSCNGSDSDAIIKYVDFVSERFEKGPICVDAASNAVRIPAMQHAIDVGLGDRVIYDALGLDTTEDHIAQLKEMDIRNTMIMAQNHRDIWPGGQSGVLDPHDDHPGLLQMALATGAKNILIDVAYFGVVGNVLGNASIPLLKERYGWPTGGGPSNTLGSYRKVRQRAGNPIDFTTLEGRALEISFYMGALYQGIDYFFMRPPLAPLLLPAFATTIGFLGYYQNRINKIDLSDPHPLTRYLK
jgi:N5-methyltetrahydromethanopterin:coenzyme M methyltransferase subunit H